MSTAEEIQKELDGCLDSINSAGLDNIDLQNIEKLDKISAIAAVQGMSQGKKLIDNLSAVLKAFKEGKSAKESVSVRLTALDFYLQNIKSSTTEDL
jgi:hypothetical protein